MSDSGEPAAARQDQSEPSEREENENLAHAVDRLREQFAAHHQRGEAVETDKTFRERATVWLLVGTLLFTGASDFIFWCTMQDARNAATKAHQDNIAAINQANFDSQQALIGAHIDSDNALRQANTVASDQHQDTLAALVRASEANDISRDTSERQLRAYISVTPNLIVIKDDIIFMEMNIHNAGQTPARRLQMNGAYFQGALATPKNLISAQNSLVRDNTSMQVDVFPGVDRQQQFEKGIKITDISNINSMVQIEYISGMVTYYDIFGIIRKTSFCIKFDPRNFAEAIQNKTIYFDWCPSIYNRSV